MSIEQTIFNADDPRLTAYALGELSDPAERAQVEQLLSASPEARAELADIRALTAALTAEYDAERAAASAEETPANVVSMTDAAPKRSLFSRFSPWWAVAAVMMLVAVGVSLPVVSKVENKVPKRSREEKFAESAVNVVEGQINKAAKTEDATPQEPKDARVVAVAAPPVPPVTHSGSLVSDASPQRQDAPAEPLLMAKADRPSGPAVGDKLLEEAKKAEQPQDRRLDDLAAKPNGIVITGASGAYTAGANASGGTVDVAQSSHVPRDVAASMKKFTSSWASPGVGTDRQAGDKTKAVSPPGYVDVSKLKATGGSVDISVPSEVQNGNDKLSRNDVLVTKARPYLSFGAGRSEINGAPVVESPAPAAPANSNGSASVSGGEAPALGDVPLVGRVFRRQTEENEEDARGKARAFKQETRFWNPEGPRQDTAGSTAQYTRTVETPFLAAKENPLSTFSIDVDTASYAITRRFIESGSLPPPDAVRVEELLNYFPYADAPPAPDNDKPFAIHLEAAACPWDTAHRLVRVGIKGREMDTDKRPPSNLVFLLDVSGSMSPDERLPLVKKSLRLLVNQLREDDRVSIVVYAGASGLALPPTTGDHKDTILRAIETLKPGGSTNGASGIKLAYNMARKGFRKGGTNRVILATDGDFNVGVTNQGDLIRLIEEERKDGIFLSVLGVGTDNLKDSTMQTLADHGNGNYNYIDRLEEGRKVLVNQMSGTLVTIAKDVKIQVEFNPAAVASYRLIGYEKRMLKKEDFNNDKIDAGEIGAGHNVTALYEVVLAGQPTPGAAPAVDALKYGAKPAPTAPPELDDRTAPATVRQELRTPSPELLTVKMRHKAPDSDMSERSYEVALVDSGAPGTYSNASPDFQFSAAVASFGMLLRDSPYKGDSSFGGVLELAQAGKGEDPNGYRKGFIELVREARGIQRGSDR